MSNKLFFVIGAIAALSATVSEVQGRPTEENGDAITSSAQSHEFSRPPYQCNNSMASFEEFYACHRQSSPNGWPGEVRTKPQILNYLKNYCKKIKPSVMDCTLERASNCTAEVRQGLEQGGQAGLLCESGGTGNVNPGVQYLFDRLGDVGVTEFRDNRDCQFSQNEIFGQCYQQALQSAFINTDTEEGMRILQGLPLPELFQKGERYLKAMANCSVAKMPGQFTNSNSSMCDWRVSSVLLLTHFFFPPMLGVNFPFTHQELDTLFQFENENNAGDDNVEAAPLLSLLHL